MERADMAQSLVMELQGGRKVRMDFDMGALAYTEGVFEDRFGKPVGVDAIIGDLVQGKSRAMMAFAYGAMMSAGEKLTWEDFCKSVWTFANYKRLSDAVIGALVRMVHADDDAEGSAEKNADSRGAG